MFRLRYLLLLAALLVAVGVAGTYHAAQDVPDFYEQTLALPPEAAHEAGDEFEENSFALANDVREEGAWSALFTDTQVNGWLAVDLPKNHPELLPKEFSEPRLKFTPDGLQFGMRRKALGINTVVWLDIEVKMSGKQEAALRFRRVRAGKVPLPLGHLLDGLSEVAKELEVPLRWTTVDGDPTAVIGLPALGQDGMRYELDKLKVEEGRLFVSGRTTRVAATNATAMKPASPRATAAGL